MRSLRRFAGRRLPPDADLAWCVPESAKAFAADPYDFAEARAVADELGLSEPVAVTLVRRGYRTPEEARAFLAADETHPPEAFEGMEEVAGLVLGGDREPASGSPSTATSTSTASARPR